jgi:hypothetical protein
MNRIAATHNEEIRQFLRPINPSTLEKMHIFDLATPLGFYAGCAGPGLCCSSFAPLGTNAFVAEFVPSAPALYQGPGSLTRL